MMKLDTVIPYLREIQKIYKSSDVPLRSADISICLSGNTDEYNIIINIDYIFVIYLTFIKFLRISLST